MGKAKEIICHIAPSTCEAVKNIMKIPGWPVLKIVPRGKNNIFENGFDGPYKDLLPDFLKSDESPKIKKIETHFYVDLAVATSGGKFTARRKLTAVVRNLKGKPMAQKPVHWEITQGGGLLNFEDERGNVSMGDTTTDANGLAEITITHPAADPSGGNVSPGNMVKLKATIDTPEGKDYQEITLWVMRNNAATTLDKIKANPPEHIWVHQPDPAKRSAANPGIKELQEMLNEVVARHRGVRNYAWIPLNGVFGNETRDAVKKYLSTFTNITAGADYPYNLSNIGISENLKKYVNSEYKPFSLTDGQGRNLGQVVDRRLLVGDQDDTEIAHIDGLTELKTLVVDRLVSEMDRVSTDYINCDTFWLHRPIHQVYRTAPAWVFRVTRAAVTVQSAANAAAAPLADAGGNPVIVGAGDLFPSPAAAGAWVQISHPGGRGWVLANAGRRIHDDQANACNSGIVGHGGVAYSFGCKDLPARFTQRLQANPLAPPVNGAGHQRRIAHWDEYAVNHKVGRRQGDGVGNAAWHGPNSIPSYTGCDCTGLVQNSITEAKFENPNVRVVPNAFIQAIVHTANNVPQHAISPWVANNRFARIITMPGTDADTQWVRKGDLIETNTHILWVAEDLPANNGKIFGRNKTFEVYQASSRDRQFRDDGTLEPAKPTNFLRKVIRCPYNKWRNQLADITFGKVYIWR